MADILDGPAASRFVLRAGNADLAAAGAGFGVALPVQPCRSARSARREDGRADGRAALWLGPDEWLLLAPEADGAAVAAGLAASLVGRPHALVDVGHRQVALVLSGPAAADVLAAGCPLDLGPAAFPAGACTRTLLGKAEIVLWREAPDRFRIEAARSLAAYVRAYLEQARRDWG